MPLLALWRSNPEAITKLSIEQIVATAGDGKLRDQSDTSSELREYLAQIPSEKLGHYAEQCLEGSFQKSGLALQDVVNELGRRLGFGVENGRYQGVVGGIGFDGIWRNPDGGNLVVEVKTTDAYRISLDTIASYRRKLQDSGKVDFGASVLIIVGREDTGELEAQVRGSRHAWDMRLISVDALSALVKLKENTEAGSTEQKIRSILSPREYTRLDGLIDVLFTAAKDVEVTVSIDQPAPTDSDDGDDGAGSGWRFTDPGTLNQVRQQVLEALGKREGINFVKRSRALYSDVSHSIRAVCTVSKRYTKRGATPYWYAYHPAWDIYLGEGAKGWLVLGCVDLNQAFAIPVDVMRAQLDKLNMTIKEDGSRYSHVKIVRMASDTYALQLPKVSGQLPLQRYALAIDP